MDRDDRVGLFRELIDPSSRLHSVDRNSAPLREQEFASNFLVGLSVSGIVGVQAGVSDWGLGLDIGVTHIVGKALFLEDLTWGAAFKPNMRPPYAGNARS